MVPEIHPAEFPAWRARAATHAPDGLPLVIDVRELWEVQTASIREDGFQLLHIPMREIPAKLADLTASFRPAQPIACLCHHGLRSLRTAEHLLQNGFTNVVNVAGGIDAWSQQVDPSVPAY